MKSPFKFLDSYTKDDREIFFGRDREIEELYHRVFESKIMLVYGVSGTGKSSLIHCGLANKFQETDWLPIVIRRGGNIIESMVAGIRGASVTEQQSKFLNPADFKKGVRSLYLDHYKPVFFIFDQFEELFIFGNKEERRAFIHIVKLLVESELQCRLIFVMREEYMAWVTEFEKFIPTFFSNRVRIEKMSHRNALEAIKEPCKVFNISLEEGFAETLLEKLSPGSEDVELTYLQVFLDKIFRLATGFLPPSQVGKEGGSYAARESKEGSSSTPGSVEGLSFTLELLQKTGNVSDLLGSFLEEQISHLDNPEEGLIVLKSFVSVKGTKRLVSIEEISDFTQTIGKPVQQNVLTEMLQTFTHLRILHDKDQNGKYELRHDALASKIYEKITSVEKEVLEIRNFIENAFDNYKKRNVLLGSKDLEYISRFEKSLFLKGDLGEFLRKSKERAFARIKAFRMISTVAGVAFLLIILGLGFYSLKSNSGIRSRKLALESLLMKNDYPVDAWEIANEANNIKRTPIAEKALFESFYSLLEKGTYYDSLGKQLYPKKEIFDFTECNSEILFARFSDDGELIYGYLADTSIKIWDKKGHYKMTYTGIMAPLISVKLSGDNKLIGALDRDSTIYIFNSEGKNILRIKAFYNIINPNNILNFSPGGKLIACVAPYNRVFIYKTSGEMLQILSGHQSNVTGVNFSPDNRFLATSSYDSTIMVWYFNKNKSEFEEYIKLKGHRNIVWSARFSMNSNYILTASADSTVKIWDLNGKIIKDQFIDKILYFACASYCDAVFMSNDNVIIKTRYRIARKGDSKPSASGQIIPEIIFDQQCSIFNMAENYPGSKNIFSSYFYSMADPKVSGGIFSPKFDTTRKTIFFTEININQNIEYSAYSLSDNPNSTYYSSTQDAFKIFTFSGRQQQFSKDGKYLLTITNNCMNLYPCDTAEISRLVNKGEIFGKIKSIPVYYNKWYDPK